MNMNINSLIITFWYLGNPITKKIRSGFIFNIYQNALLNERAKLNTRYNNILINFYSQFIKSGDICFDIGSNTGSRIRAFLDVGSRKVVAVEPLEICIKILKKIYGSDSRVILVDSAIGSSIGDGEIFICNETAISSMSQDWINATKKSSRFNEFSYNTSQKVRITTLDYLIELYGIPVFIKIDVEGYEFEVIKGLTKPIKGLSFEYTPEYIESTKNCINYLKKLGPYIFNYSIGESFKLQLTNWIGGDQLIDLLNNDPKIMENFGDIYAVLT